MSRLLEKDVKLREGKIVICVGRKSNERTLKLESVQIMDLIEYMYSMRKELLALSKKENDESI